jgi:DNA polymerase III subunit epsilon
VTQSLREAEFLAVDCETNARGGEACELTEVAAVLVGGGECHEEYSSLVAVTLPLTRGAQRLTGISQAMLTDAPAPEAVLNSLVARLQGRVLVAHNASFDARVLRHACRRAGVPWPDPPVLCTVALARRLLPLQSQRALGPLAEALGIEMPERHRALPDARACAGVLCHLFARLCSHAATVDEAVALLASPRRRRAARLRPAAAASPRNGRRPREQGPCEQGPCEPPRLDFGELPRDPGVYIFRDEAGRPLYVGKSVSIRSRARAHFAPSAPDAQWRSSARLVDYQATGSELGALVLENRLIKRYAPPGNLLLNGIPDGIVYVRCRFDVSFPVLEVARDPASGHAVNIGPLRGRRCAIELVEQLNSLFGLRHCGRRIVRRDHPSAYGQMGRCLSPCLGDLDPNLYRTRLDEALALFGEQGDGGARLLGHVEEQMHRAADEQRYERAHALHRRLTRLRTLLDRLGGSLGAVHARSVLLLAPHPVKRRFEAFRLSGGRLADWGPLPGDPGDADDADDADELARWAGLADGPGAASSGQAGARSHAGHAGAGSHAGHAGAGSHVPPEELDEVRILGAWMTAHPETPMLPLPPAPDASTPPDASALPDASTLRKFVAASTRAQWPGAAAGVVLRRR